MKAEHLQSTGVQIRGFGHYFPEKILSDKEIEDNLEFKDVHPTEKTVMGDINVHQRHRSSEKETSVYMAVEAGRMALKDSGISPDSIDLLIVGNWTERWLLPDLAVTVAVQLGLKNALSFDLGGACAGFIHGVHTAMMYLGSGKYKRALIIGSERFSIRTRPRSRGEFITGDAAGAVVLEQTDDRKYGIIDTHFHSDGNLAYLITTPFPNGWIKSHPDLPKNAIEKSVEAINGLLERNRLKIEDIDWVAPHPGTDVVLKGVTSGAAFQPEQYLANFHYRGNTSSASVPIVLSEFYHSGRLKKGDLILGTGVGAGWYWGGFLFRL